MKSKYIVVLSLALMMPLASLAASRNSEKVTFAQDVRVGGTLVHAGDYRVQWEGTGTSVKASIIQGKKVIASAPATLVEAKSIFEQAVYFGSGDNDPKVVQAIEWRSRSLHFDTAGDSSASALGSTTK